MTVNKTENGNEIIFKIEGRIDTNTSPELEKALGDSLENADSIVLDFSDVQYISSAGLRVLLMTHKVMAKKGGMTVIGAEKDIKEIFEVTGFSDFLNIE